MEIQVYILVAALIVLKNEGYLYKINQNRKK